MQIGDLIVHELPAYKFQVIIGKQIYNDISILYYINLLSEYKKEYIKKYLTRGFVSVSH